MKRARTIALALAVGAALTAAGASRSVARKGGPVTAARATKLGQLPGGPAANGRIGDFILSNGRVTAVIDALGPGQGAAESGGNLVDLAPAGGDDAIRQVFLFLAETFPRQALYRSLTTRETDDAAEITVKGFDSMDRDIAVETTYRLEAAARHVALRTTVTNHGKKAATGYGLGDVIQWGHAERFLPGQGPRAKGRMKLPWVAGAGRTTSFLYGTKNGPIDGIHGGTWSDLVIEKPDLAPGQSATFERFIAVGGDPGLASAYDAAASLLASDRPGLVEGTVTEADTGAPVQALVVALAKDAPVTTIASDAAGRFACSLPAGRYTLTTLARQRAPGRGAVVDVTPGGTAKARLEVSPPGSLEVEIATPEGPSAGKLILEGLGTTQTPELGPAYAASGAANTAVTRDGRIALTLPPGAYRATCSRGIEFDIAEAEITVPPARPGTAPTRHTCLLRRAVETPGRVSFDLHTHAAPSYDAAVSLVDRVTANLAEGLEGFVASDHNVITDFSATVAALGVRHRIVPIVGNEATVEGLGHFNAYPLTQRKGARNGGAPDVVGIDAAEVFRRLRALPSPGDKVLQVNHPRAGREGYFDQIKLDPAAPTPPKTLAFGFDAIEVVNGKRIAELPRVLADYFSLLRGGHRYTAVGNSDSHAVFGQEAGYPRNLIRLGTDDPARVKPAMLVRALKVTRDVVVTNGPILEVDVGGVGPGGLAQVADPSATPVHVQVQAAPWVDVDRIEIYVDGTLQTPATPVPTSRERVRFDRTLPVAAKPGSFILVSARGEKGLDPIVSSPDQKPVPPVAVANPIWIGQAKAKAKAKRR